VSGDGAPAAAAAAPGLALAANRAVRSAGRLKVVTTMATWCAACKGELPQLATLRAAFGEDEVAMFGVPVDPKDSAKKLSEYAQKYQPAYDLLTDLRPEEVESVQGALKEALKIEALPSTLILDADGRVLEATTGLPTISTLRRLLDRQVR
jgi:peroxiredoxin